MGNTNNARQAFMKNENYQSSFSLDAADSTIYESIINIPLWWTEMFEGSSNEQRDRFTVRFGPAVFKTMVVDELIPNRRIAWNVVDSFIDIPELKEKSEWINTQIIWDIKPNQKNNTLTLTHIGLTRQVECYTICINGWQNFTSSLIDFIKTGVGNPFRENNKS